MKILGPVAAAFSTFSAIPVPYPSGDRESGRWILCAFPLVGAVIGLLCWAWAFFCSVLELPAVLRGAGCVLIPVLATGGIHLDGYADTSDALASCAAPERKREILSDPHLGAFAAIRLCAWFIADFALWVSLPKFQPAAVILLFSLSRSLSGLAVAYGPLSKKTGMAHALIREEDRTTVKRFLLILSTALCAGLCLCGWTGPIMAATALAVFFRTRKMAQRQFGGLSGDVAGWFLHTAEIWMLGVMVLEQYVERCIG